jgi:hypothetical protein
MILLIPDIRFHKVSGAVTENRIFSIEEIVVKDIQHIIHCFPEQTW